MSDELLQAVDVQTTELVERLRERTAMKYMGDCKCGRCQLIPLEDVRLAYDTIRELYAHAVAAEAARDEAVRALERCRTVLGNMAEENEGAIFRRWPIHHEPLRSDAKNLLPIIDAALLSNTGEAP